MINPIKSLKLACAEAGISLSQACREAGVHQQVIDKWNRKLPRSFELYNKVMAAIAKHQAPERKNPEEGC